MSDVKPIPGFNRYGITSDARLFNLETRKELKTSRNSRGYYVTILVDDFGHRKGVKRHRLVGLAHLEHPEGNIEDFVINHKDSTPGNDWKDNLEWCTQKWNVEHWQENGKEKVSIPVEVLDVEANESTFFESIGACSRTVGIGRYPIHLRLERGPEYIWPEGKRYRVVTDEVDWPSVKKLTYGRSREVLVKDLKTNTIIIFSKLTDTLPLIGYKLAAVWKWANDYRQPVIPGLFQIQFADTALPWREVDDVFEELQDGMHLKVVFRFDSDWGNPIWYESARACGKLNGLAATALNYRLKSRGQKVFSDGKRYCYYSDLSEFQKKTIRYEIPPEGRVQRPSKAAAEQSVE